MANRFSEEGCFLPSSSNDTKIMLAQIKREIKELSSTTEAKLLSHDGKIAELCKYIKTNLSNTIRELLDTMVTSGELDTIILETITELGPIVDNINTELDELKSFTYQNMRFYLPNGRDYTYGQFLCLGVTENKACLFDCGYLPDSAYNLAYLKSILGFKKLDYVFISHYHGDHYGGLTQFTDLYDKDTIFYIAKNPENYYSGSEKTNVLNARESVIYFLQYNGYKYVEVEKDMFIELEKGIKLNIYNNSDEAYNFYRVNGIDDYNNYSFVIECEIENKHVLLGFDAVVHSQTHLLNKNQVSKVDVLFDFHHGNTNICNREYMLKLNPDIVVQTLPPINLGSIDGTESYSQHPNYNYKYLSNARNEVVLNVNPFSVEIEKGDNKHTTIRNHGNVEVYLNPDYTGTECIGTADKPFKTFNQIFELIPKSCQTLTINVSGSKMKTNQRLYNTFDKLIIKGNPNNKTEFYNFQMDNCKKVEISDIKFTENIVYLFNSDARFTDCEFDINQSQNVNITNSNASFIRCEFKNSTREALNISDKSIVRLSECEINAPTYGVSTSGSTLYINKNTITGTRNYYRVADDSQIIGPKVGSTSDRPNFGESYYCNGYTYFDSELNRLIYYDSDGAISKWKTADGTDV